MSKTITVSDIAISKDSEGRFSLKDLHEAAGKERRHEPSLWIRLEQTKEIIEEIKNTQICVFSPIAVKRGCKGGTYVCKELVYSYAMWISASFSLKVIRAYDEMVTVHTEKKTTVDQRTPLRDAINMLVSKKHLLYPEAYALIHQRFNVEHIDELPSNELPTAIEYVHKLALEGEYIPNNANALNLTAAPIKGIIALHFDGSGVVRTEFVPEGATVATLHQFESLVRHRGGVILWDDLQQREFVRERAMLRL